MKIAELGLDPRISAILEEQGITELYPPQADAIGAALAGKSLVLAIPTASGESLAVVVADEVHLIHDAERGPTLEVTLAKLRQVNPSAQVIALSATIGNSEEIAAWLEAEHVTSEWRPVPLRTGVFHDGRIRFSEGGERLVPPDGDGLSSLVVDILSEGGQAIVFVNTRRATESLARKLSSVIRKHLSEKDTEFLHKISEGLGEGQEESTSMAARLGKCIEGGAAFHNAGLTNDQRSLVETQFRRRRVKCIVANPTLDHRGHTPARKGN